MTTLRNAGNNEVLMGVTNLDKLRKNKSGSRRQAIHQYDPFGTTPYSKRMASNIETETTDPRWQTDELRGAMMSSKIYKSYNKQFATKNSIFGLDDVRKRERLREIASYDKMQEILLKVADEVVVTNNSQRFCEVVVDRAKLESANINPEFIEQFVKNVTDTFAFIYRRLGFMEEGTRRSAWSKIIEYLIDGKLMFETVFDNTDNPKQIMGFVAVDPLSFEPFIEEGYKYWVHKKEYTHSNQKIVLYDSQILAIDWNDGNILNRSSYVEGLVRAFNVARIIEESRIIWNVTNAQFRLMFVIPTKGKGRIAAAQTLLKEQQRHEDHINFDGVSGEMTMNGEPNQEFQKNYFVNDSDSGRMDVSVIGGEGHDLSDTSTQEYYDKQLLKNARLPLSRYDRENNAWSLDVQGQIREEINTGRFINRVRSQFGQLLIKPVIQQVVMNFPELINDNTILSTISLKWNSYAIFEELKNMEIIREKVQFIREMRESLVNEMPEGRTVPFFSMRFLVEKFLTEISEEDLAINKKYIKEELEELYELYKKETEIEGEVAQNFADITDQKAQVDDGDADDDGVEDTGQFKKHSTTID